VRRVSLSFQRPASVLGWTLNGPCAWDVNNLHQVFFRFMQMEDCKSLHACTMSGTSFPCNVLQT
jgi:hypothetical protein